MKRLVQKMMTRCLNSLMGGVSLPVQIALPATIQNSGTTDMQTTRVKELPWGKGRITYRIPNVVEQLRFHSAAKWYDETVASDGALRTAHAIEAIPPFIVSIEGSYASLDEVMADRGNTDALIDIALDIAGKRVPEPEKKL